MPASLSQVARTAGVSVSTVSRYVRGQLNVTAHTASRINAAIRETGWQESEAPSTLHTIGLIIPELRNPFFAGLSTELIRAAASRSLTMPLYVSGGVALDEARLLAELSHNPQIDAIILVGMNPLDDKIDPSTLSTPLVLVDEKVFTLNDATPLGVVTSDNFNGAYQATNHLIRHGHRHIAYVGGSSSLPSATDRERGYRAALAYNNCEVSEELMFRGPYSEAFGASVLPALASSEQHPTAVFASSDIAAVGILGAAENYGLSIPGELSLVGFDGIILSEWLKPRLTSVRQPIEDIARHAITQVRTLHAGERCAPIEVPMQLVTRGSVRAITDNPSHSETP